MLSSPQKFLLALCCALLPATGSAEARRSSAGQQAAHSDASLPVFEFHSGFWINLHHFLYRQARERENPAAATQGTNRAAHPGNPSPSAMPLFTPEEQRAWSAALDYYAANLAERDLLVNGDMVNIKNVLAQLETCPDLAGRGSSQCASGLRPELIAVLEAAAPAYRARWWAEHDRSNRAWIVAVGPLVRQLGGRLAEQLQETYHAPWPVGHLRVDVAIYGGPFGAYTSLDPVHLTISSADPRNQGPAALEVLFHEASHALAGAVRDAIVRECRQRGKPIPRDLWHALLFYTTGEIVKRALQRDPAAAGAPGSPAGAATAAAASYTPYAYRHGLYARGWSDYQRVLERYWQPYLEGRTDFDNAIARLVSAL